MIPGTETETGIGIMAEVCDGALTVMGKVGTEIEIGIGSDVPHQKGMIVTETTEGERTPGNEGDKEVSSVTSNLLEQIVDYTHVH
jgi:hypothetical protein